MQVCGVTSQSESRSVVSDSSQPRGLYSPWNSPGQNTGVGSLSLLQGIFPTQESNPGLLHFRRIPYQLSHKRPNANVRVRTQTRLGDSKFPPFLHNSKKLLCGQLVGWNGCLSTPVWLDRLLALELKAQGQILARDQGKLLSLSGSESLIPQEKQRCHLPGLLRSPWVTLLTSQQGHAQAQMVGCSHARQMPAPAGTWGVFKAATRREASAC